MLFTVILILLHNYLDCQIGAAQLTHPAANEVVRPDSYRLFRFVDFENLLWTEMNANATSLAPVTVDQKFL
jgi:hypothetical protein